MLKKVKYANNEDANAALILLYPGSALHSLFAYSHIRIFTNRSIDISF